jgi:signal transduction histidine kinase
MQLLAGIVIGWTAVQLIIVICCAVAYVIFGKNRFYLLYALFSLCLIAFFLGRAGQYLASDFAQTALAMRLTSASIPLGCILLFYLAIHNAGFNTRWMRISAVVVGVVGVGFAGVCAGGICADEGAPSFRIINPFFFGAALRRYPISIPGIIIYALSLVVAVYSGLSLAKTNYRDRSAKVFFYLATVALLVSALNDLSVAYNVTKSAFTSEYGLFFVNLCVVMGFLRSFEISRRALQERSGALERATERLDWVTDETRRLRPMADLGRLSASLAHEIRNPLAVLNNVASTLLRQGVAQADSERYYSLIRILQEETDRLARLVDDLLAFSHAGRVSRDPINPASLVEQATSEALHQTRPESSAGQIVSEIAPDLPSFTGNAEGLRRALLNLLVNAIQSSPSGAKVKVVAHLSDDSRQLLIGVMDEAGGISEHELAEIFEPFFSTRPTGTGLGLPIAKSIAEAHNGTITLENRPGIGATFWLSLPIIEAATHPGSHE